MTSAHRNLVLGALTQDAAVIRARRELLARHGVNGDADGVFDAITDQLAEKTGFPYGMINFRFERQRFAGLHNPPADSGLPIVGRDMDAEHGWCPHVVTRRLGLPLHNIHASRLYSGSPTADRIGANAYFGEPLIYPGTGIVLGTVCVLDLRVHELAEADAIMADVEVAAADTMANILAR
ncbi:MULTISPECIES: GAF domain-containing protein [unclassified Streptomyces]|uniref:GAF domain-containing protein n=1 Tax=unclassified Streptomyces TaxID=2593676 RepID=UPI0036374465